MLIQVNYANIQKSDVIDDYVHERVNKELAHFGERITRVEVHLHDDNSPQKSSPNDKRCKMEARPAGRQPLTVEQTGNSFQKAIADCAGKLNRALKNSLDKVKDH